MPSINTAYTWMINACNAPNIGYSQKYRRGQNVNGITYYDCSSLISQALTQAGYFETNPWFTTYTMGQYLLDVGAQHFKTDAVPWQTGDILVVRNASRQHTEMCYEPADTGGITMGAHTANVPLAQQVSINNFVTGVDYYTDLYRLGKATKLKWISKNNYLTEEEMQNNAYVFYSIMWGYGFTLNAVAGMLGNFERESNINPGLWQNLDQGNYSLGFGLAQWTPATNYTNWAKSQGFEIDDGDGQCLWLDTQTEPSGQWIPTPQYKISWSEFKKATGEPEYLASAFLKNFERAGVEVEDDRRKNARKWYEYLKNFNPNNPHVKKKKKSKLWLYTMPLWKGANRV